MFRPKVPVVEEDGTLGRELEARCAAGPSSWPVSVTDLLDPRSALFRRLRPVPFPEDRRRRRSLGAVRHARWLRRMGPPDRVEVRLQRNGVVGIVDLLEPDGPTELKTSARVPDPERWTEERGAYVDQLGVYAALAGSDHGRLVVVPDPGIGAPGAPGVLRCRFRSMDVLLVDAAVRADRLRRAFRSASAAELPRCPWYDRRCPYRAASACDCRGDEPADDAWVREHLEEAHPEPDRAVAWSEAIRAAEGDRPPVLLGYADLQYPRRAYFERTAPERAAEPPASDPRRLEAYRTLAGALEAGPDAERSVRYPAAGEPPGSVPCFRGGPFVVKVRAGRPPPEPWAAAALPSNYRDELGFRCAAVGASDGWAFVDCLGAPPGARRIRAVHVHFEDITEWTGELDRRRSALEDAIARGDPSGLRACPDWRREGCPYRPHCGCDAAGTPS